jgi:hypothetical protein
MAASPTNGRAPMRAGRGTNRNHFPVESPDADPNKPLTCGFGADDGIRTRDPHLGKVVLYQLSHVRMREGRSSLADRHRAVPGREPQLADQPGTVGA